MVKLCVTEGGVELVDMVMGGILQRCMESSDPNSVLLIHWAGNCKDSFRVLIDGNCGLIDGNCKDSFRVLIDGNCGLIDGNCKDSFRGLIDGN